MKKVIILMLMLICCTSLSAQHYSNISKDNLMPGMSYRQVKHLYPTYEYHMFSGKEIINPTLAGVSSFFVPGLGQILAGETTRGLIFLASGLLIPTTLSIIAIMTAITIPAIAAIIFPFIFLSIPIINIWATIDAINVAKVMNMYQTDLIKQGTHAHLSLQSYAENFSFNTTAPKFIGMSLNFRF